jgi:Tfp pilus assembly ATPase PilU
MSTETEFDYIALANTRAKGKRPIYLNNSSEDRLLSIIMALAGEVGVMRERLDTVERLLETNGTIDRADIEKYHPNRDAQYERGLLQREFIARILRGIEQEMQTLAEIELPLEDIVVDLRNS